MEHKMRDRKTEIKSQKNQDEKEKQSGEKAKTLKRVRKKGIVRKRGKERDWPLP
jgi:hypothetical protein